MATSTAIATVAAADRPIQERNSMRASTSATKAVNTVMPAKSTDDPAVPTASPAASGPGKRFRSCLKRERMNRA